MSDEAKENKTQETSEAQDVQKTQEGRHWYIVQVYSNCEHAVAKLLRQKIVDDGMEERIFEVVVPTEEVMEMQRGKKRRVEKKFFPGYVLVNMIMDDETRYFVNQVPKILNFVGGQKTKSHTVIGSIGSIPPRSL